MGRRMYLVEMDAHDFSRLRTEVLTQGYAVMKRYAPGARTHEVAVSIGTPIEPWPGAIVQRLVPRRASTPNTYSGIFGMGLFPFHTDLAHWPIPPRFLLLRCLKGYPEIPTLLFDGMIATATIGADTLSRAVVTSRRPVAGEMRLLRILDRREGKIAIRWDEVFLKPASRIGKQVFDDMCALIASQKPKPVALIDDGDTAVIDNWRMLHARPAVLSRHRGRHIERVYLEGIE